MEKLDISCPKVISLTGDLNFGNVIVGSSPEPSLTLRVSNAGTCPLHLFAISIPLGFGHNFIENSIIQPNQFLDIAISFNPDNAGIYSGIVTINSDATSGISSIVVLGQGLDTSVGGNGILKDSGNVDFGTVQQYTSVKKTFVISNDGDVALTVNSIQSDLGAFTISGIDLPINLEKKTSKNVDIQMNTTFVGALNGNINIYSNFNNVSFRASGIVIGNGILTVSGDLNFDTVKLNSVAIKTLSLSNIGTGPLLIDTITSGSNKFSILGLNTPFSLDVNQSQSVNINLNTSVSGIYNTNINIMTNANDETINANGVVVDSSGNAGCPASFIDTRDGELYQAKMLAGKCWMTENLRYDTPNAGDDTPYFDNSAFLNDYGRYYKWQTLMDGSPASNSNPSSVQGLCPNGWHVPSQAEIQDLLNYYGNDSILAFNNLALGGASGLDFRLGGSWVSNWFGFGSYGFYWTTSGNGGTASSILISQGYFQLSEQSVAFKIPCRCVKN